MPAQDAIAHLSYVSSSSQYFYDKMYLLCHVNQNFESVGHFSGLPFHDQILQLNSLSVNLKTGSSITEKQTKKIQNKLKICR